MPAPLYPHEREELETLRAENAVLKSLLNGDGPTTPAEWGLSPTEQRIFARLLRGGNGGVVSRDALLYAAYGFEDDAPEPKIIDVFISHIRRKTEPFGVQIETIWGQGWRLLECERWV